MPSFSVKRQRKRKRIDEDGEPEFQVAPMVDVLLVLMLFFMSITSTELMKKEKNLTLASASNAKPDKDKKKTGEIVVNVSWDSSSSTAGFNMDGIKYPTADALQGVLASRVQQDPRAYVLVRADKDVEYSNISDVMTACSAAGIGTVTFGVITGGTDDKKPASPSTASSGG
jgi:biopolymer transport protein ExbD